MQNVMQSCIHQQEAAIRSVLKNAKKNIAPFLSACAQRPVARVVLVGAGSSFHSLNMARPLCQQALGLPHFAATPAQLSWLSKDMAADTLVIAASQSGTSSNTLAAVRALQADGFFVTAVTQEPASLIAKQADCHVLLDIAEEKAGPKTMGVLGTILTVQKMIAALATGRGSSFDVAAFDRDMAVIADSIQANIDLCIQWCMASKDTLAASTSYCVVAQGEDAAIAGEAALKLVETVRVAVTPYEFEEIVHGPLLHFRAKPTMLYLGTPWEEQARPEALRGLCAEQGGHVFPVMLDTKTSGFDGACLTLKSAGNPLLTAFELLLPAQVISAYIPPVMGIDLDAREHSPLEQKLAGHL